MFEWAVSQEMIPSSVREGVLSVKPLERGRGGVREGKPVQAVPDAHVEATLGFLPPILQAMVQVQRHTGMRSGELVQMTPGRIDCSDANVWIYRPPQHKTLHRGYSREIPLGPKVQQFLTPYLDGEPGAAIFSPARAVAERKAIKRAKRKSKVQPSQVNRQKRAPKKQPGITYDSRTYFAALRFAMNAAKKAGLLKKEEFWHPHQLRHAAAARVQQGFGLDAVRAFSGHRTWAMTAHYAKRDLETAKSVAAQLG